MSFGQQGQQPWHTDPHLHRIPFFHFQAATENRRERMFGRATWCFPGQHGPCSGPRRDPGRPEGGACDHNLGSDEYREQHDRQGPDQLQRDRPPLSCGTSGEASSV